MPIIKNIIGGQNRRVLNKNKREPTTPCNCRNGAACPLQEDCRIKSVNYQDKVTRENKTETYAGLTEGELKTRFNNHKTSFLNNASKSNNAELSKYILVFEKHQQELPLQWSMLN